MKKILGLAVAAMLVMAMVGTGTWAFFSDSETSTGNILSAGTMDLTINNANANVVMFTLSDMVPGDTIEGSPVTITLKNIGSITGDLTLVTTSTNTESTGTTGTASAGGTTTTMIDAALIGGSADDWVGYSLQMTGGTGANIGQRRMITASDETNGEITVAAVFPAVTAASDTYSLLREYELDAINGTDGELGGYVELSIWLNQDGSLGYTSGTPGPTVDVQLLTGGASDSAAQVFDSMASLTGTWLDIVASMALGASAEISAEWRFPNSGDQNDSQGDSVDFGLTFTLDQ